VTDSGQARSAGHLGEGAYKTLTLLETTGPAPLTATHKRSAVLLAWLVEQELVGLRGQLMDLTDKGREALAQARSAE
jgi:hypothetical protein